MTYMNPVKYYVFHDESIPDKRWLLIGLIFVQEKHLAEINTCLHKIRQIENYFNEIHFCKLPKSFYGEWGAKARVAKRWIKVFESDLCEYANFSLLAVDKVSKKFERHRFGKDFHCYNRFTAMALKAGISWHISPLSFNEMEIEFVSDKKDRCTRPDKDLLDNFEQYLPYRVQLDSFLNQYKHFVYPTIKKISISLEDSKTNDLIQLCDILLGATQSALVGKANRDIKLELGREILSWYYDLLSEPWNQKLKLHRKVNFWTFPDGNGQPSNKIHFVLDLNPNQLKLFP